jgi:hypothetical protein
VLLILVSPPVFGGVRVAHLGFTTSGVRVAHLGCPSGFVFLCPVSYVFVIIQQKSIIFNRNVN